MKTSTLLLYTGRQVRFLIGTSDKDNFQVIDASDPEDIWFHIEGMPSCHIVAELKEMYNKYEMNEITRFGAQLCKEQHAKYKPIQNLPVVYTEVKNIKKTKTVGSVVTKSTTMIRI